MTVNQTFVRKSAGNLTEVVDAYLTNGRYDPRKSQTIAENYKIKLKTIEERRKANYVRSGMYFEKFKQLVSNIPTHTSNAEHFSTLVRPISNNTPIVRRHSNDAHLQKLRTPNALMQTNKIVSNQKPAPHKRKSYGESKLIHPNSRVKPTSQLQPAGR